MLRVQENKYKNDITISKQTIKTMRTLTRNLRNFIVAIDALVIDVSVSDAF